MSDSTVSTHVLDTGAGRPAAGIGVELAVRGGPDGEWAVLGTARTDAD
ncbi:hydroxyisourate hydrolase, partial [Streptomyces sp. UNOB3_S3]